MNTINQKLQIVESLNELDQKQTQQVLAYIQGLTRHTQEVGYEKWKKDAMRDIRKALKQNRSPQMSF